MLLLSHSHGLHEHVQRSGEACAADARQLKPALIRPARERIDRMVGWITRRAHKASLRDPRTRQLEHPLTPSSMGSQCSKASAVDLVAKPNESSGEHGAERELSPTALCASMQASLATGTRYRSLIKKFPKCFAGHEAVHWMLERKQARDAGEAVRKCQTLLGRGLLEQVDGAAEFDDDPKRLYRFTAARAC